MLTTLKRIYTEHDSKSYMEIKEEDFCVRVTSFGEYWGEKDIHLSTEDARELARALIEIANEVDKDV